MRPGEISTPYLGTGIPEIRRNEKEGPQPRPMLGRLPWFAFERRSRALRFLVFFDIGMRAYSPSRQNELGQT
jgi:hypothetical protein